jgi:D-amino peptidase
MRRAFLDSPRGLFAHTGSGVIRDLQINGRSVGEGRMNAALAMWYGVPVVAVSEDDVAVAQVKESVPGVKTVAVKRAINMRAAELKPLQQARREIQDASRDGVAGAKKTPPQRTGPYRVRIQYRNFTFTEVAGAFKEIEVVAPRPARVFA